MLGKTEGGRRKGRQRMRRLDGITDSMDVSLSKLQEGCGDGQGSLVSCSPQGHKELDMTEQLNKLIYMYTHTDIHTCVCTQIYDYI